MKQMMGDQMVHTQMMGDQMQIPDATLETEADSSQFMQTPDRRRAMITGADVMPNDHDDEDHGNFAYMQQLRGYLQTEEKPKRSQMSPMGMDQQRQHHSQLSGSMS